jgi:hypothetical protein
MTSCPSLLDTLGFLKFPDTTSINFSDDATTNILQSLKTQSEEIKAASTDNVPLDNTLSTDKSQSQENKAASTDNVPPDNTLSTDKSQSETDPEIYYDTEESDTFTESTSTSL